MISIFLTFWENLHWGSLVWSRVLKSHFDKRGYLRLPTTSNIISNFIQLLFNCHRLVLNWTGEEIFLECVRQTALRASPRRQFGHSSLEQLQLFTFAHWVLERRKVSKLLLLLVRFTIFGLQIQRLQTCQSIFWQTLKHWFALVNPWWAYWSTQICEEGFLLRLFVGIFKQFW